MGFLSKVKAEKNHEQRNSVFLEKPRTHQHNHSQNSSSSFSGSEFLLTGSNSSNSSNDTVGPMIKMSQTPRRVRNIPKALTPNITVDSFNYPATAEKSSGEGGKRSANGSPERKPPPPPKDDNRTPTKNGDPRLSTGQVNRSAPHPVSPGQSTGESGQPPVQPEAKPGRARIAPAPDQVPRMRPSSRSKSSSQSPKHVAQGQPPVADRASMSSYNGTFMPQYNGAPMPQYNGHVSPAPQTLPQQAYFQRPQQPESEEESEEDSEEDSTEYTGSTEDDSYDEESDSSFSSSSASTNQQQHPYYEQWMQYYASLAAQQQMMAGRNSMYGGYPYPMMQSQYYPNMPPQMSQMPSPSNMHMPYYNQGTDVPPSNLLPKNQSEANRNNDFLNNYKNRKSSTGSENGLVLNSRKSTVKSNRYPSMPLSILENESSSSEKLKKKRVSSLDLNFKPNELNKSTIEGDEDEIRERDVPLQIKKDDPTKSVAFGLLDLALEEKSDSRHISDYNKYLFDEQSDEDSNATIDKSQDVSNQHVEQDSKETHSNELSRQESIDSMGSDNSIQNETPSDFKVKLPSENKEPLSSKNKVKQNDDESNSKEETHSKDQSYIKDQSYSKDESYSTNVKQRKDKRKSKQARNSILSFNPNNSFSSQTDFTAIQQPPPQAFQPPPMMPSMPHPQMSPMDAMMFNQGSMPFGGPMGAYNTEYQGMNPPTQHGRRQSITTSDAKRQSMIFGGHNMPFNGPPTANRMSMPHMAMGGAPKQLQLRTSDSKIKEKVEKFVELRQIIASGNKSLEYRLKWIKMLINATNYCLYAYVNIKGDPSSQDQALYNKTLFVKSSVNHLLRLVKEYKHRKTDERTHSEVCYIYGCLLKQDYLETYNQDFGIEKDIPESIAFFEKALELNPNNFKSLYKLGDIYEYEYPDQFEEALKSYKEAAKLGYNRAIYKMSLLYLNVSQIRSTKFFNYLVELSNIDLTSKDVDLQGEDRDELEEIVGLAFFQLGKIYEGIYPGDLTTDDEFITKSLEQAPVNYAKSLTYYNKSAKLNCLLALVKLGTVYENGELNRQQNPSKSIQWYMKAVSSPLLFKRHPDAMLGLSRWNLQGSQGLSKYIPAPNPEKAIMWCDRAIKEFDVPEAYFAMGELTELGLGDRQPKDWFIRAYELGHTEAATKLGY